MASWLLAALVATFWFGTRPPPLTVQGEVSSDRVDIKLAVAARVEKLNVNVGDAVKRGDVLAVLDSPQLVSARLAAEAALAVARADLARVNLVRPETVAAKKAEVDEAQADVTLALQTFNSGKSELLRTGNTPQASLDQARTQSRCSDAKEGFAGRGPEARDRRREQGRTRPRRRPGPSRRKPR